MRNEPEHNDADDTDEHDHDHDDAFELELSTQSQIFLEMRAQNLELLKIAAQVTGYTGGHGVMKPGDSRRALKEIWEVFSEFYAWIDPEEAEDDDDDLDEDDD
jgi:hypothetical protein